MKKYQVYIVINVTCQEVYFGAMSEELEELFASVHPPELSHWELEQHHISVPVLISRDLSFEEALADLLDLEEKALANPQGKKILHNSLLDY
ncbi:MAG: hypothetical protein IKA79_00610 [Lentisphaeria bacterium]|nr:hypothetical protein [Lentisphaeria bacterium]